MVNAGWQYVHHRHDERTVRLRVVKAFYGAVINWIIIRLVVISDDFPQRNLRLLERTHVHSVTTTSVHKSIWECINNRYTTEHGCVSIPSKSILCIFWMFVRGKRDFYSLLKTHRWPHFCRPSEVQDGAGAWTIQFRVPSSAGNPNGGGTIEGVLSTPVYRHPTKLVSCERISCDGDGCWCTQNSLPEAYLVLWNREAILSCCIPTSGPVVHSFRSS